MSAPPPNLTKDIVHRQFTYIVSGVALASFGLLVYTLTRPTRPKVPTRSNTGPKKKGKFSKRFTKKPIECNLVMFSDQGFHAHVATDRKNKEAGLKYGARLISINGRRVEDLPYEEIFELLTKVKAPINLKFREFPELEEKWAQAEQLKDEATSAYKNGDTQKGIEYVSRAIELHNTNKTYYSNRILMYLKVEDYDKALLDCHKIRELDPKSVYIKGHYLRGLVLFNLKKYKNAASAFQTVVKLSPGFKQAKIRLTECLEFIDTQNETYHKQRAARHESLKKSFMDNNESKSDVVKAVVNPKQEQELEEDNHEEKESIKLSVEEIVEENENTQSPESNSAVLVATPESNSVGVGKNENTNNTDSSAEITAASGTKNANEKTDEDGGKDNIDRYFFY